MRYAAYITGSAKRIQDAMTESEAFRDRVKVVVADGEFRPEQKRFYEGNGAEFIHIDYMQFKGSAHDKHVALSDRMLEIFCERQIDHCFSTGGHILAGELLNVYRNRMVNFHPSLLPKFKGRYAIDRAIAAGEKFLGNTAHFIDDELDHGPIILQKAVPAEVFFERSYDGIIDLQKELILTVDDLLVNGAVSVENDDVKIRPEYMPYLIRNEMLNMIPMYKKDLINGAEAGSILR